MRSLLPISLILCWSGCSSGLDQVDGRGKSFQAGPGGDAPVGDDTVGGDVGVPGDGTAGDDDGGDEEPLPPPMLYIVSTANARATDLPEADRLVETIADDLLIELLGLDPPRLEFLFSAALRNTQPAVQNLCAPTVRTETRSYDPKDETFRVVQEAPIDLGQAFHMVEWEFNGALDPDARRLTNVALRVILDVADLSEELDWTTERVCDVLLDRGSGCVPCGEEACAPLRVVGLDVEESPGSWIEPLTIEDVEASELCFPSEE